MVEIQSACPVEGKAVGVGVQAGFSSGPRHGPGPGRTGCQDLVDPKECLDGDAGHPTARQMIGVQSIPPPVVATQRPLWVPTRPKPAMVKAMSLTRMRGSVTSRHPYARRVEEQRAARPPLALTTSIGRDALLWAGVGKFS